MAFQMPEGYTNEPKLWLRPHEVQLFITCPPESGELCSECGAPLARGMFAWDHRITNYPDSQPFEVGEDRFDSYRHADGGLCAALEARKATGHNVDGWNCHPKPRCPKCRQYDTLTTKQQGYGDLTTCTTPGCDYENWYDIGD